MLSFCEAVKSYWGELLKIACSWERKVWSFPVKQYWKMWSFSLTPSEECATVWTSSFLWRHGLNTACVVGLERQDCSPRQPPLSCSNARYLLGQFSRAQSRVISSLLRYPVLFPLPQENMYPAERKGRERQRKHALGSNSCSIFPAVSTSSLSAQGRLYQGAKTGWCCQSDVVSNISRDCKANAGTVLEEKGH